MRFHKLILLATSVGLTTTMLFASDGSALPAKVASPLVQVGPKAVLASNSSADYGLFTCQIVGLNSGGACYDPYQIRHAYGIDTLINAGYSGSHKTIVIVDAFQSPNIVAQLNTFNTFYALPSLNGLGATSNPNLGTFNIVAPDGTTPFVSGNANMTGWAEEISLDVLWATPSPRAQISRWFSQNRTPIPTS